MIPQLEGVSVPQYSNSDHALSKLGFWSQYGSPNGVSSLTESSHGRDLATRSEPGCALQHRVHMASSWLFETGARKTR